MTDELKEESAVCSSSFIPHPSSLLVQQFLMPKNGVELSECEDAIGINRSALRFALADGATEAFDAQNWARRLAEHWAEDEPPALSVETFKAWVSGQGKWLQSVWRGRSLSWYAEEKAQLGSFAAFVGVQFELTPAHACWHAIALGDSCLIQLRAGMICDALPISDYNSFTSTPLLVSSQASSQAALAQAVVRSGSIAPNDLFLLMSDAVAAWYLKLLAERDSLIERFDFLLATGHNEELARLFESERGAQRIKDDDIAILRIAVRADDSFSSHAQPK